MTYNAIQYLRNNSAVEGKEADRQEELLEERRSKVKDNLLKEELERHSDVFTFVEKAKYKSDAPVKVRSIEESESTEMEEVAMMERTENPNSETEDIRIRRLEEMTLQLQKNSEEILKRLLVGNNKGTSDLRCESCGGTNHLVQNCWHRDRECYYCKQKSHISSGCLKNPRSKPFAGKEKKPI
jgi:hypothetical protein